MKGAYKVTGDLDVIVKFQLDLKFIDVVRGGLLILQT